MMAYITMSDKTQESNFKLTAQAPATASREELLREFIEVPRDMWGEIVPHMQIRVEGTDGRIRTGGYIVSVSREADGSFRVSNFPYRGANYKEFTFKWGDLQRVWKRIDRFSRFEIARLQSQLDSTNQVVQALQSKTQILESAVTKLVKMMRTDKK